MSSADDAVRSMLRSLEEKTGKNIDQWVTIGKRSGATKHGEIVKYLKTEHGLGHGYANLVAHTLLQSASVHSSEDDLIEAQYGGAKAALRPIYEKLMGEVLREASTRWSRIACGSLRPATSTRSSSAG
jgi:hypothetical protein